MLYAGVRLLNVPYAIDKRYTYHIPIQLENAVKPGSIVVVPFGGGNSEQNAVVETISTATTFEKTKPILGVPGKYMFIREELLKLCHFMSDRLFCSVGDAVRCVLPSGLGVRRTVYYSALYTQGELPALSDKVNDAAINMLGYIERHGRVSAGELRSHFGSTAVTGAERLTALGLCQSEDGYECKIGSKNEKYASLTENTELLEKVAGGIVRLPAKQRAVYEALLTAESGLPVSDLMQISGAGSSVLTALAGKGVIHLYEIADDRSENVFGDFDAANYGDFTLSEEQEQAFETLLSLYQCEDARAALLWGVTGSGKTNVILKLIDRVLESGKTVLVLVPEIALTAQTVGRFAARYAKEGIALIHSALSAGERVDAWKKINDGAAKIVIGTRSAVFAPVENLGLIVMDEEHEGSFKSDKSPKYHARDIAKFRCVYNKALLVMASATPSIESFYKAKEGKYTLVTLRSRYGAASLPSVSFYDMKSEPYYELPDDAFDASAPPPLAEPFKPPKFVGVPSRGDDADDPFDTAFAAVPNELSSPVSAEDSGIPLVLGKALKKELADCLARGEQAILFVNRRGYRAFAVCRSCGYVFMCPNCSVSMTHHRSRRTGISRMVCHYCGYSEGLPTVCPTCHKARISFMGSGTQLVEETLRKQFPDARVLRMDADTTSGKFGHEKLLTAFRAGEADILVGTQMVAKGHDFPRVSLVGVAMADTSLFVNDFRANEKTFSLLTQVLGRAGRAAGTPGRAVVQTYVPENEVLRLAAAQDYEAFYDVEIAFRKASLFPPFCDLVTVNFASVVENDVINAVKTFGAELDALAKSDYPDVRFILFGPFRHEIYRLAGKYRMRFILKCRAHARMRTMLAVLLKKYTSSVKDVIVSADVNPTNL